MGKAIKWLLIIVGALVALFVLALVLVAVFVDPNDYKPEIEKAVADATGMELVIEGDIGLDVFPWIALDIGKVTLKNPPEFGEEPFVALDSAAVGVRVLPLITGSVEAGDITVDNLKLNLIRLENGAANWEALSGKKDQAATDGEQPKDDGGSGSSMALSTGDIKITQADIVFDDRQAGKRYELKDADITLGSISPGDPFAMGLAFEVSSTDPQVTAQINCDATVTLDLEDKAYGASDLTATIAAQGEAVPGGKTEVNISADKLAADLNAQTAQVAGLTVQAYDLKATLAADGASILDEPSFTGSLAVDPFNAKELLKSLGQTPPETGDADALTSVSASLNFDYAPGKATARDVKLALDQTTITAQATMTGTDNPAYAFQAMLDAINLDRYLPPKKEGGEDTGTQEETASSGPEQPFLTEDVKAQIRKLNLDGELRAGKITTGKSEVTDVLVSIRAMNGVVDIKPASFNLYEGSFTSNSRLDVSGPVTRSAHSSTLRNLEIGDLMAAMAGEESLSGNTNADVNITASGDTVSALKKTLNGNLAFDVHDGVFPGIDFAGLMEDSLTQLENSSDDEVQQDEDASTKFGLFQGTATMVNGLVTNEDLLLKSPFVQVDGEGQVNLPTDEVDYLVVGALLASSEGQGRGDKSDEFGIGVPIRVKGTFSDLSFYPDLVKWGEMALGSTLGIVGDGVEGIGDLGGSVIEGLTGGGSDEGSGDAAPAEESAPKEEESSDPIQDLGNSVKGLF